MTVSKKLRFEVFKRDGFQCAYCGKTPPEVVLEIDHIEPKSRNGTDDISNLITACFDCNRGKSNIRLDKVPTKLNENLEILRAKEEQLIEYRRFIKKIQARVSRDISKINKIYQSQFPQYELSDKFKKTSMKMFLSRLPFHEVEEAMEIAVDRKPDDPDHAVNYFCGVCWRKIKRDGTD